MKIFWLMAAVAALASASTLPGYTPTRVSYQDLLANSESHDTVASNVFLTALREVGLVSITDIPSWNKQAMFQELERCAHNLPFAEHVFPDGTLRQTLATRSVAGHAEPLLDSNVEDIGKSFSDCAERLEAESREFRFMVQDITNAVAAQLHQLLKSENEASPFVLRDTSGKPSYTIERVINEGEHLEHFHSFYNSYGNATTAEHGMAHQKAATIDWHTDQGLLLAFTPGQRGGDATTGFFIRLADESAVEVDFDVQHDDLVIMLGDGVNQYLNPILTENGIDDKQLRAVPHSLVLATENQSEQMKSPRLWYGCMVLPPPQALHPSADMTFEDMRLSMINKDPEALLLGCASHKQVARELTENSGVECSNATSSLCWHECMNYTDFDASPEICEGRSLSLGCVNDEGLLWIDTIHNPAFGLGCVNLSEAGENVETQ